MRFNKHLNLQGEHAFLSPSQHHWINYTPNRLAERWTTARAAAYGTAQHLYAQEQILAKQAVDSHRYLGDVHKRLDFNIYGMTLVEQVLYYSENCFGTADAISFKYKTLRIFDLKTGMIPGSVHQLEIYAALFCLEYEMNHLRHQDRTANLSGQ